MGQADGAAHATLDEGAIRILRTTFTTVPELVDLLRQFQQHARNSAHELVAAAGEGDAGKVGRLAHTLKSMARLVGAQALAHACLQVERRPGERALGRRVEALLAEAEEAIDALVTTLERGDRLEPAAT